MLDALKFVKGAVARKDYQPALTHFKIGGRRVLGYNGTIALSSPIAIDLDAMPKALPFVAAIERCKSEATAIHITPGGKLSLKSGGFKANIDCADATEVLDAIKPEGEEVPLAGILGALTTLEPFIGYDASKPWATGILLRGCSAYATNNIILAEYWIGDNVPEVNIPSAAVAELIRIKEEPVQVLVGERSMTFFYKGDRWMRTQLLSSTWPDISPILNAVDTANLQPIPEGMFDAIDTLKPFIQEEGRLYFREGEMLTSTLEGEGASKEITGLPSSGAFHHEHLSLLRDSVKVADFTCHPKPCPFQGGMLRGVILGMIDT